MALPPVWQIGTGDDARPYAGWFFEHHVAAVGPGSGGRWPRDDDYAYDPSVLAFARDAAPGHLVIAKQGRRRALGIGVLGSYDFDPTIDVEGWDLCHLRRTRWLDVEPRRFDRLLFAISRFCRCTDPDALAWVTEQTARQDLSAPAEADLPPLPDLGPELELSTLDSALATALTRGRDWADNTWEGRFGPWPSEAEMLCHVTVPILQALGWPAQLIAVESAYRDVALFRKLPRIAENCEVVIEGKGLGLGLAHARAQVTRYAAQVGHPVDVAVTDGPRMLLYRHAAPDEPLSLNCSNLRESARTLLDALRFPGG